MGMLNPSGMQGYYQQPSGGKGGGYGSRPPSFFSRQNMGGMYGPPMGGMYGPPMGGMGGMYGPPMGGMYGPYMGEAPQQPDYSNRFASLEERLAQLGKLTNTPVPVPVPLPPPPPPPPPDTTFGGTSAENLGQQLYGDQIAQMQAQINALQQRRPSEIVDTKEQTYNLGGAYQDLRYGLGVPAPAGVGSPLPPPPPPSTTATTPTPTPTPAPTPAPTLTKDAAIAQAKTAGVKGAGGMSAQELANALKAPVTSTKGKVIQPQAPGTTRPTPSNPFTSQGASPINSLISAAAKPKSTAVPVTTLQDAKNKNMVSGGVVHKGMTNNLKKMLKNK